MTDPVHTHARPWHAPRPGVALMTVGEFRREFERYTFHMPKIRVRLSMPDGAPNTAPMYGWDGSTWRANVHMRVDVSTVDARIVPGPGVRARHWPLIFTAPPPMLPPGQMREAMPMWIRGILIDVWTHEIDEFLWRDGVVLDDPHEHR